MRVVSVLLLISFCFACADTDNKQSVSQGNNYFVSLADIHFDPFVACYQQKVRPCPLITKLKNARPEQWQALLDTYDHVQPGFHLDTNYPLFRSSLKAASSVAKEDKATFVLVLGDFLAHKYHKYYQKYSGDQSRAGFDAFVAKTMSFLTLSLKNAFPGITVLPVIGNNDTNGRDYQTIPNSTFLKETAVLWSGLQQNSANRSALLKTFPYAGYYAIDLPAQPTIRVLVLNSVLFSYKSKGDAAQHAANAQIAWFKHQLAEARQHHQRVLIAMHIPIGIDVYATLRTRLFTLVEFWRPPYVVQFNDALKQYSSIIMGVLSGHLHSDWFQVLTFGDDQEIALSGTPSISPIFGNNPGFKVYRYSASNGKLEDYYTYYFPVFDNAEWGKNDEFDRTYQPNCQHCSILDGMKYLQRSGRLSNKYQQPYRIRSHAHS